MLKRFKSRKAISPVIATLLLILIAIAAGVVVYAYVTGFVQGTTSAPPPGQSVWSFDKAAASSSEGSLVQLYVRQEGASNGQIDQIYQTSPSGVVTLLTSPTSIVLTMTCSSCGSSPNIALASASTPPISLTSGQTITSSTGVVTSGSTL